MTIKEIVEKYTAGEMEVAETNEKLKEAGAGFHFTPGKNTLTEEDKRATTIGYYPDQANGYGLLDTATGTLDKAKVTNGKFIQAINTMMPDGKPNMPAYFTIAGHTYAVHGDTLVEL
jgi:hypothetical protein